MAQLVVAGGLGALVGRGGADRLVAAYRDSSATYRVDVVFPVGEPAWYRFDLAADPPRLARGRGQGPEADVVHRIAAFALVGWARRTRTFFSVRASSRRHGSARRLVGEAGRVDLESRPLADLLMYYVLRVAEGSELSARHEVDRQLEALRDEPATSRPAPPDL